MIYGRSGLTTSWCLKGRFRIYDIVGCTNQLTRFIFLYSGQMKTRAPNNKEKSMFNDTIKIIFMWKTVIKLEVTVTFGIAFAILRKAIVSFVMSVCPSVRLSAPIGRIFMEVYILEYFSKICRGNTIFIKI